MWFESLRPREVSLHLCVSAGLRGRWVTPLSLKYLAAAARSLGAIGVWASPQPEHIPLVRRLGFQGEGPYFLHLYVQAQNSSTPTASTTGRTGS